MDKRMKRSLIDTNILIYYLILVTRNTKDFRGVKDLEIYNPFKMNDQR